MSLFLRRQCRQVSDQFWGHSGARNWIRVGLVAVLVWTSGSDPVSARRPDRAVILIGCAPASDLLPDPLCQALQQELARQAPDRVPRLVAPGQEQPQRAGDLGLRLERQEGPDAHKARLVWFTSEKNVNSKTGWVPIPVTESPLSFIRAQEIARTLLDQTPGLADRLDQTD